MKAQGLRRTLTLANVLLGLGICAAGGWYVWKVRPASAEGAKRGAWVKGGMDTYLSEAKNAQPATVYPVKEKELEAITRPDLMDPKRGGVGVFPFVGPVPPKPLPPAKEGPKQEAPKGLSALGRVGMASVRAADPRDSSLTWVFNSTPPKWRTFVAGDLIDSKEPPKGVEAPAVGTPRAPGMYLVSVAYAEDDPASKAVRVKVTYELVGTDPKEAPKVVDEIVSTQDAAGGKPLIGPAEGTPEAAALAAKGVAPVVLRPGEPPPIAAVHVVPVSIGDNAFKVELDEVSGHYFRNSSPEALIGDVKTEEVKDEKGNAKGIRVTGVGKDSVVNQFGVIPGDILKSINGIPVHSRAEALEVVKKISPDVANVSVVLERSGRDLLYNVDPRDPKVRAAAGKVKFTR